MAMVTAVLALAACAGPAGPAIDAAVDGGPVADASVDAAALDAAEIDAVPIDAPPIDAPVDAAVIDAAVIDAPPIDAPLDAAVIDAAVIDAPPLDAAVIDAVVIDAVPVDAGPIDAPTPPVVWPALTPVQVRRNLPGYTCGQTLGSSHVGWQVVPSRSSLVTSTVLRDATVVRNVTSGSSCPMATTVDDHLLAGSRSMGFDYLFGDVDLGSYLNLNYVLQVVAADPGGGAVIVQNVGGSGEFRVRRMTAAMTIDPGFADFTVPLLWPAPRAVIQGDAAAARITLLIDTTLRRFDARTGAPITGFGGTGAVPLGIAIGDLLALAVLPGDGLALIARTAVAHQLAIHRLDASGGRAAPQLLDLGYIPDEVYADPAGRLVIQSLAGPHRHYQRRFATTGALDPSFGTDGNLAVEVRNVQSCPVATQSGTGWAGALGDGTLVYFINSSCWSPPAPPTNPQTYLITVFGG